MSTHPPETLEEAAASATYDPGEAYRLENGIDLFNEEEAKGQLAHAYRDTKGMQLRASIAFRERLEETMQDYDDAIAVEANALGREFGCALANACYKIEGFSDLKYIFALVNETLEDLPDGCDISNRVSKGCYQYLVDKRCVSDEIETRLENIGAIVTGVDEEGGA